MLARFHDLEYIGPFLLSLVAQPLLTKLSRAPFADALLGKADSSSNDSDSDSDVTFSKDEAPFDPSSFRLVAATATADDPVSRKRRRLDTAQLVDDCPVFDQLPDYVSLVAGASIRAARALRDDEADVAIAWTGGRHHGKRGVAAGFCYINDIVLAIQELRSPPKARPSPHPASSSEDEPTPPPPRPKPAKISRVLYLDLDLHHGDGVESAFFTSPYVLTLSTHLHAPLFFPSTGSLHSHGPATGNASYHALNLALEPGLSSSTLLRLFESSIDPIFQAFSPDAVVVQCGTDGLQGDPCAEWNLSAWGMGEVVRRVVQMWGTKTLLLGGGGYESANAARCWAYLTSVALGRPLPLDTEIPSSLESDEYELYQDSFTLDAQEGQRKDMNTEDKVRRVEEVFRAYKEKLEERYRGRKGNGSREGKDVGVGLEGRREE
ncbi:BZ3500_MvSof-1268-A1-R1_Chr2-1g04415 [Microbotryum saponariae]|uniref:histone deacetylase n=1 Tax=Microbotryum saponariae TaxID=289078 RepID=A0A2X0MHK9_9BASI|nr:BZ3500_MvSof-1268-A1-R1_Chr2-1g04415 [Microbotryum saponariae]SCZ91634.1 BZ3501_MvSof-1269-A2-R1_Chr2-1g04071 [Microbotryum saponariae]